MQHHMWLVSAYLPMWKTSSKRKVISSRWRGREQKNLNSQVKCQRNFKSECFNHDSAQLMLPVLNSDLTLGLCAREAGKSAVPYCKPTGVIHASQEAREGTTVPHDIEPSRTFPAVGNVPHPQIRSTDTSEYRGCRKTEQETKIEANV